MGGAYIDLAGWKHREHFEFFRGFAQPFFSVCVDVDLTVVWQRSREPGGPPFLLPTLFAALQAANAIEPLRLRIREDRVWRHDRIGISTTVLRGDETFGYARFEDSDDFPGFAAAAERIIGEVRSGRGLPVPDGDDVVYHSTLPWLRFTAFSNALPLRDSVPRFVFGKCVPAGERMVMPVAVEVHHAVVHGLDVARFFEQFQARLDLAGPA
jgi:chloramphenicol O-acetyltransferase type A